VVQAVAAAGHTIVTGCAVGGDQQVIAACLAQGLASRLVIFAAFGSNGVGAWKGSAVGEVLAAAQAGATVQWWAGGGPGFTLVPRLKQRSTAAVQFVAEGKGTKAVVGFVGSQVSPGTWSTALQAIEQGISVVVFQSPKLTDNLAQFSGGTWLPAGNGVWAAGWKWFPRTPVQNTQEVETAMSTSEDTQVPYFPGHSQEWRVADGRHAPVVNVEVVPPVHGPNRLEPYASIARHWFEGETKEKLVALWLNDTGSVRDVITLASGDETGLSFQPDQIFNQLAGCTSFILVHNHTTGWSYPSSLDKRTTHALQQRAAQAGMELVAHLVIAHHKTGWTWSQVHPGSMGQSDAGEIGGDCRLASPDPTPDSTKEQDALLLALICIGDWPLDPYRHVPALRLLGDPQWPGEKSCAVSLCALRRYARSLVATLTGHQATWFEDSQDWHEFRNRIVPRKDRALVMREEPAIYNAASPTHKAVLIGITALLGIHLPRLFHAIYEYGDMRAKAGENGPWPSLKDQSPFFVLGKLEGELRYLQMVVEEGKVMAATYTPPTLDPTTGGLVREQRASYLVTATCNAHDVADLLRAAIYAWRLIKGLPKDEENDPQNYYTNWYVESLLVRALAPFEKKEQGQPRLLEQPATYAVPANAKPTWTQEYLLQETPTPQAFTFEEPPNEHFIEPKAMVRVCKGWAFAANLCPQVGPWSTNRKASLGDKLYWVYVRGQDGLGSFQKVVYIGQYHPWAGLCEGLEVKLYDSGQSRGGKSLNVALTFVRKSPHDTVLDVYAGWVPLSPDTLTLVGNWFAFMEKAESQIDGAPVKGAPEYRQATFTHLVAEPQGGYQQDFSEFDAVAFVPVPEKERKPVRTKMPLGENNGKRYSVPIYQSCLIKDKVMMVEESYIHSPLDAAQIAYDYLRYEDQEQVLVIALNGRNRVIGCLPVYRGSMNTAMIHLAELFKAASILGAPAIILFHNHPAGDPSPSPEDVKLTELVIKAGKLLDIEVLDHVIVADQNGRMSFYSLNEHGHTLFTHNAPFQTGAK
jgi:DNA repair protein RadC